MRAAIGRVMLFVVAGASLGWLFVVVQGWRDAAAPPGEILVPARPPPRQAEPPPQSNAGRAAADESAPEPSPASEAVPVDAPSAAAVTPPASDAAVVVNVPEPDETGEAGAAAIGVLPDNGVRDAPQRYPDDPAPIEDLLGAPSIWCDFGMGNNMGVRIEGQLTTASAAWAGDPLELDLLDVDAGTVRLRGSLGATGSRKGEVKMRVIADGARIHFMGLLPTGTLVTITIYGDRHDTGRESGRHVAVMSRHEPGAFLTYGVQYLGSCE